jgi:hypothetical protein
MGLPMKLYAGKLIKNKIDERAERNIELRDAIVWDVDPEHRYCRVKIQGSDSYVKAYYPENWESTPQYLKPGNAVRITHPGGSKGRIEVTGFGILLPTAVPGGEATPTPPVPSDAVLTGLEPSPIDPAAMKVGIAPGTYRINSVIYSLSGLEMDRTDVTMDRPDLTMDEVVEQVSFDAADGSRFRYDSITVGSDGVVDVIKGTYFYATADEDDIPDPPEALSNHVRLGWVLIYPSMTAITNMDINRTFSEPVPTELRVVVADDDLAWGELTTTITIGVYDQFGNYYYWGGPGYFVTFQWESGNGSLTHGSDEKLSPTPLTFYMDPSAVVTYTRDGLAGDKSPSITITDDMAGLTNAFSILLRNAGGDIMM